MNEPIYLNSLSIFLLLLLLLLSLRVVIAIVIVVVVDDDVVVVVTTQYRSGILNDNNDKPKQTNTQIKNKTVLTLCVSLE